MKVRSADGHSLGKVISCDEETFFIEKGLFFPKDYIARYDQVSGIKEGELWLSESGERLKGAAETRAAASTERLTGGRTSETAGMPRSGMATATDTTRIPLAEEELTAEKRSRPAGEVKIAKDVVTEQKEVSVPVKKEEVRVERVPASGEGRYGEASFRGEEVTVPVEEEEVEIHKRPVVTEEIRVSKDIREEEQRLSAEARKETANIDERGDVRGYDKDETLKR